MSETYTREYFNDNYAEMFASLRNRYHARTQKALRGRAVDHAPVSNISEYISLHEDDQGGTYITTGDFITEFNRRFGGNDRIGAMKQSIAAAEKKAELRRAAEKRRGEKAERKDEPRKSMTVRSARPRFAFMHAVFGMMLTLSLALLLGTGTLLDTTAASVAALEEEIYVNNLNRESEDDATQADSAWSDDQYFILTGSDSVESYPAENNGGVQMPSLLSALSALGK